MKKLAILLRLCKKRGNRVKINYGGKYVGIEVDAVTYTLKTEPHAKQKYAAMEMLELISAKDREIDHSVYKRKCEKEKGELRDNLKKETK